MKADPEVSQEYTLYVMRAHYQVWAKQKMLGNELYKDKVKQDLDLYKNVACPKPEAPEIQDVEKYKIVLECLNPNLQDLYSKIREVCPEFHNKRTFHLYWKYSSTDIVPITNHITYLSMMSWIAKKNNCLYLIAREWGESWMTDTAATYVALPEDRLLVNMVAPKQSVFTAAQEQHVNIVKAAAKPEFTRTYNPPVREDPKRKTSPKGKGGKKEKSQSPKSKGTKKK